jgi:hypothetical protein
MTYENVTPKASPKAPPKAPCAFAFSSDSGPGGNQYGRR